MADYKSGWTGAEIDAGIQAARNALPKSGGTMTGALTLNGTPTSDNQAATKKYIDDAAAKALPKTGGTMTGALTLNGSPTSDNQAATKKYVDDAAAKALPKSGGTMTGTLTLSGSPASDNQAATKKYVDDAVKNVTGGGSSGTPNAVQYVPQELTEEQQAQARANISAASGDWFLIADITTTEEVNKFYFNTDANGNPLNCTRIITSMELPEDLTGSAGECFGTGTEQWGSPSMFYNPNLNGRIRSWDVENVEGNIVFRFGNTQNGHFWSNFTHGSFVSSWRMEQPVFTQFCVLRTDTASAYPIGTRFVAWGCKV